MKLLSTSRLSLRQLDGTTVIIELLRGSAVRVDLVDRQGRTFFTKIQGSKDDGIQDIIADAARNARSNDCEINLCTHCGLPISDTETALIHMKKTDIMDRADHAICPILKFQEN
jgi:hypothetical protein